MTLRNIEEVKAEGLTRKLEDIRRFLVKGPSGETIRDMEKMKKGMFDMWNTAAAVISTGAIRKPLGENTEVVLKGFEEFFLQVITAATLGDVSDPYDAVILGTLSDRKFENSLVIDSPFNGHLFCLLPGSGACLLSKEEGFDFEAFCKQLSEAEDVSILLNSSDEGHSLMAFMDAHGEIRVGEGLNQ